MLSVTEIKRFIDEDISSEKKRLAAVGQRYAEGDHDILKCRLFYYNADGELVEDTTRTNIKIPHPFFMELSEQLAPYMLSFKENPIRAKKTAEGLQDHLDRYFDDAFWAEINELITGAYTKGFEYLYSYKKGNVKAKKSGENKLIFKCADSMGVIEVREQDTDDHCKYIIYWYIDRIEKGRKEIKRIQVWSEQDTTYYVQDGKTGKINLDKFVEINPRPHVVYTDDNGKKMGYPLGYIPFWRLDNNKKQFSGLKPIKGLIDDYDLHACSLSNNLADFDTPLHVVKGFDGHGEEGLKELQQNLKTKKIVGVDAEGGIDIKTVDIPYEARKAKLDIDEKAIYKFGMGLNTYGLKDTNATTNMAIKTAYAGLKIKADRIETRLRALLHESIVPVVLEDINEEYGTDYRASDVSYNFERETMTNETENIQNAKTEAEAKQIRITTILNIAEKMPDEQILRAICDEMDWDYDELEGEIKKLKEEQEIASVQKTLDNVVPNEEEPAAQVTDPTEPIIAPGA
ncbi:MAG: phage portal protein [Ruminococcaceae bacterium]|nr:phage portal protein [Oscillospiraceae bacterium]